MEQIKKNSRPISLREFEVKSEFWKNEMELVRKEVIPYQWEILNDRVEGAAPSFCMRNFKVAGKLMQEKHAKGAAFSEPKYTFRGFEALPEDMNHLEDKFYGFVFQDSDFSKWIEAVGYTLTNHPDKELERIADEAIDIVCAAQQDNGYLDTYYIINGMDKAFTNLRDHHELYCFGHLVEGAVSYYQATGKDKLLKAAMRFADYIDSYFGESRCKGYPGHEIAEMALVRLYEATGEERYLKLSRFFLDERGAQPLYFEREEHDNPTNYAYHQAHLPVREQSEAVGHAVRAVYLYSGMTDVAGLTGDEAMWAACNRLWDSVTKQKMYITGGIGATSLGEAFSYPYDLPNDLAYAETCASIGLIFWARRMLEIAPKAEYADVMEQALYNTVLSGMALDGKSFFYVNPLEVTPDGCKYDERKSHVKNVRQKWFGCACCPPNLARLISSLPTYAYTAQDDTLWMHLYIGGTIRRELSGKPCVFEIETNYPWEETVTIRYTGGEMASTLGIRIPGWCSDWSVEGAVGKECYEKDGYLYITGEWTDTDCITLTVPMEIRLVSADSRVREDLGKAAVVKGPVVYCAEEADNGKDLHLYRLLTKKPMEMEHIRIAGHDFPAIRARAKHRKPVVADQLYTAYQKPEYEDAELLLIPYYAWANRGENEMRVWLNVHES